MSSKKIYAQRFRNDWLSDKRFKNWLSRANGEENLAYCTYCYCTLQPKLTDISRHSKTKKHLKGAQRHRAGDGRIVPLSPGTGRSIDCKPSGYSSTSFINMGVTGDDEPTTAGVVPVHQEEALSPSPSNKELIIPASIGFIGCGNMAQALMNAFLAKGLVDTHLMMASAPSYRNLSRLPSGMRTTNDNNKVVRDCDIIFICVKPQFLSEMIEGLDPLERDHNPLFVSIVTGFDITTLEQMLGSLVDAPRVVRTMPNTPSMIGQGCCVYTLGTNANDGDSKVIQSMLHAVGYCAKVPEFQIDAACGLAGSGPAYIYAAIEALADGGVKMGLPRQLSQSLAAHMVKGAAAMVLETGKHPAQLKDEVCSPAGTTITAMHSLEKSGFRNALISAVEASANRSKELGSKN